MASILAVAAFVLSVAVGTVAWLQWRVADNKLRLDLFDRRYKVYEATQNFVDSINKDPTHVDSYLNDFNVGTSNAEFLFDADVLNYIKLVRLRAVDMRTARELSETEQDGEERTRNIKKCEADRKWLIEQATAMTKTFAPYLGFANVVTPTVRPMNKKRKILTLVALAVFSVIIALHYYGLPKYEAKT